MTDGIRNRPQTRRNKPGACWPGKTRRDTTGTTAGPAGTHKRSTPRGTKRTRPIKTTVQKTAKRGEPASTPRRDQGGSRSGHPASQHHRPNPTTDKQGARRGRPPRPSPPGGREGGSEKPTAVDRVVDNRCTNPNPRRGGGQGSHHRRAPRGGHSPRLTQFSRRESTQITK